MHANNETIKVNDDKGDVAFWSKDLATAVVSSLDDEIDDFPFDELLQVAHQSSLWGQRCLRFLLMDVPLLVTFTMYVSTFVLERMAQEWILPQMELLSQGM